MKMPRDYPDGQTVSLLYLDFAIFRFLLYLDLLYLDFSCPKKRI